MWISTLILRWKRAQTCCFSISFNIDFGKMSCHSNSVSCKQNANCGPFWRTRDSSKLNKVNSFFCHFLVEEEKLTDGETARNKFKIQTFQIKSEKCIIERWKMKFLLVVKITKQKKFPKSFFLSSRFFKLLYETLDFLST